VPDDSVDALDLNDREPYERVAMNLTELRALRGWSPEELAVRAGVSLHLVEALEQARSGHVRVSALTQLANAFNVDISELLKPRRRSRH
jgi:transcriptional regulator with XRE-family HTH domain